MAALIRLIVSIIGIYGSLLLTLVIHNNYKKLNTIRLGEQFPIEGFLLLSLEDS